MGCERLQAVEAHSFLVRLRDVEFAVFVGPLELFAATMTVSRTVGAACFGCIPTEAES